MSNLSPFGERAKSALPWFSPAERKTWPLTSTGDAVLQFNSVSKGWRQSTSPLAGSIPNAEVPVSATICSQPPTLSSAGDEYPVGSSPADQASLPDAAS